MKRAILFHAQNPLCCIVDGRNLKLELELAAIPERYLKFSEIGDSTSKMRISRGQTMTQNDAGLRSRAKIGDKLGKIRSWSLSDRKDVAYFLVLRPDGRRYTIVDMFNEAALDLDIAALRQYGYEPEDQMITIV